MTVGRVLVANVGSSSVKLRVVGSDDEVLGATDLPADPPPDELDAALVELPEADAVGHRVVHGGADFTGPVVIDGTVVDRLQGLTPMAPLHNPPAVELIRRLLQARPDLPAVACFDTAFHAHLDPAAATYALPGAWRDRWPLRRFGFHGLSHAWATRRAAALLDRPVGDLRLVTCHLGAGASLAAVAAGRSVDTTMGFTPLEGLVMATRSGSVDPGLLLWLLRTTDVSVAELDDALEHRSGVLGLSRRSADLREVLAAADVGDEDARLAIAVYAHRLRAGIAAMAAAMGGVDAVVFTGGVGERSAVVRRLAGEGLGFLGIGLDGRANEALDGHGDGVVTAPGATVEVVVVCAREELEIAGEIRRLLG